MIPDPNETRDKILEAAIEVFNQKNYGDTSVNNITEVAGTSHGTFYIYFKNKRDALMELIKQVYSELYYSTQKPWGTKSNTYESMEESISGWFEVQSKHWKIIRTWKEVAHTDHEFAALWDHLSDKITLRIQQNIENSMKKNLCRDVNAHVAARAISGMIEHFGNLILVRQQEYDLEEVVKTIADLWYHSIYVVPTTEKVNKQIEANP